MLENEERRHFDNEWKREMREDIKDIKDLLQGEKGVCVRLSVNEANILSTQTELTEHKNNHWQFAGITLGGAGLLVTIIIFIADKVVK